VLSRDEIYSLLKDEIVNATQKDVDWFLGMIGDDDISPDPSHVSINFSQYLKGVSEFAKIGNKVEFKSPPHRHHSDTGKLLTWCEIDRVFYSFTKADDNNSGTLSLSEMYAVFAKTVPDLPEDLYVAEFNKIDSNKSGYVDFIEYLRWISANNYTVSFKSSEEAPRPPVDATSTVVLKSSSSINSRNRPKNNKLVRSKSQKKFSVAKLRTRNHTLAVKMKPAPVTDELRGNAFKAFIAMDEDRNGQLSEKEFTGALGQALGFNLTKSEINRLYYVVDSDHSGAITFDEFLYAVAHTAEIAQLATCLRDNVVPTRFDWEIPFNELQFGPMIGEGTFGVVHKGKWHGTPVAIKTLKFSKVTAAVLEDFRQEVAMMAKLRHPNVVLFMGACTQPPNLCIVTEFLEGGSLYSLLHQRKPPKKLSKHTIAHIALQTARGLNYLHHIGIVHRDMKSLNLLLDENYICKLCDFGLSCMKPKANEPLLNAQVGSPLWMAPELLINNSYTEKVDVYSYGVCLWELQTHQVPFEDLDFDELVKVVSHGKRPEIPHHCPPPMAELMNSCWEGSPDKRPNFEHILQKLETLAEAK